MEYYLWIGGKDKINRNIKDVLKSFLIKYYLTSKCSSSAFPAVVWLSVNPLTASSTETQMSGLKIPESELEFLLHIDLNLIQQRDIFS